MERQTNNDQTRRKPFSWFVLGWILLFLMAFTWSLDGIPSIFLGLAAICFFVGYLHSPRPSSQPFTWERSGRESSSKGEFKQSQTHQPAHASQSRKVAWIASIFVGFVFLSIIVPIIFGTTETSSSEDVQMASNYYETAQYDSAHRWYKSALRKEPGNVEAIVGYGNTLWYFDQVDSALVMFEKALSIEPENEYAQFRRAGVFSQTKRSDQAVQALKQLLDQNPEYGEAIQLMGDVYYNQQKYEEALSWYEQAYDKGLRNRWLCHLIAYLYDRKNEPLKAIPLYKEALYYDSTNTDVYIRLGELLPGPDGEFFRKRGAAMNGQ